MCSRPSWCRWPASTTCRTLNDPADVAINEDAPLQTVNLSGIGMGAPNEGQTLTVTASSGNTAIIPNPTVTCTSPNATGTLSFTPVANANDVINGGPTTVTVTVSTARTVCSRPSWCRWPASTTRRSLQFGAAPASGPGPLVVTFTDSSTDIDNAIVAWSWNFGDGGTSALPGVTNHTYNSTGTFTAQLTVTDAAGATHSASTTIAVLAGISINDVVATEGGTATFNVSLVVPPYTGNTVTVNYATANGSATAGADYTATSGTLTFNAGESVKPVTVAIINDSKAEFAEEFLCEPERCERRYDHR
ncbi:MAG: PKD domain-containing protein [Desulfomicrobium escambiense]|nr:PKD domain-containing protein [Desulfomicrobium escambiense]